MAADPQPANQPAAIGPSSTSVNESGANHPRWAALGKSIEAGKRWPGHMGAVKSVTFAELVPRAVTVGDDKFVRVWELPSGNLLRQWSLDDLGTVATAALDPKGERLFIGQEKFVDIYSVSSGKRLDRLEGHTDTVNRIVVHREGGSAVSYGRDHVLYRWDLKTREGTALTINDAVRTAPDELYPSFVPGSQEIFAICDSRILRWRGPDWKRDVILLKQNVGNGSPPLSISNGALYLCPARGNQVRVISGRKIEQILTVEAPFTTVREVQFLDGWSYLAIYGGGANIEVWDCTDQLPCAVHSQPIDNVSAAGLSHDGQFGLTAFQDGALAVWKFSTDQLIPDRQETLQRMQWRTDANERKYDRLEKVVADLRAHPRSNLEGDSVLRVFYDTIRLPPLLNNDSWSQHAAALTEWSEQQPESPTPLALLGAGEIFRGWEARGGGFAAQVNPQGAKEFQDRMQAARKILDRADALATSDAHVQTLIIEAGKAGAYTRAEVDQAFEKGRRADPSYAPLYMTMAEYLLPRWHGKRRELETWAAQCADDLKEQGDAMYAQIAIQVACYERSEIFQNTEFDYQRVKRGLAALVRSTPTSNYLANYQAYLACSASDLESARAAFANIGEQVSVKAWGSRIAYEQSLKWVNSPRARGKERLLIRASDRDVYSVGFIADGARLVTRVPGQTVLVKMFDVKSGRYVGSPPARFPVATLAISRESKFFATSGNLDATTILHTVWNMGAEGGKVKTARSTGASCYALVVSADGTRIATGGKEGTVRVLTIDDPDQERSLAVGSEIHGLAFSEDESILYVGTDAGTVVWPIAADKPSSKIEELITWSSSGFALSPQSDSLAAVGTDRQLVAWSFADKKVVLRTAEKGKWEAESVAWSPDGKRLACGDRRGNILLYDATTWKQIAKLEAHEGIVWSVAFSPDGKSLASAGEDGTVRIWDVPTTK